ncbi:MAG: hypothetical protein CMJ45_08770 [Planctomyces sp.]|jgi:mono/diheme cytochrome c family protein|nr:hypothetical protein [Planctomyces sp.]MDP7274071.1 DUF1553 domain-containing protein [Planctomycetaceae bacterium]
MKHLSLLFWAGFVLATTPHWLPAAPPRAPQFETDVRPILKAHCWQCHGEELKGKLDTRLARFLLKGGESGPALVPGNHAGSLLYDRVSSGEMPPGSKRLTADEIAVIARWIDSGARTIRPEPKSLAAEGHFTLEEQQHWSFQPIRRSRLPDPGPTGQVRSPIDAFLLARLKKDGQGFSPEADRQTLTRRLSFDLHGLPPTPAMVDEFVADRQPGAYQRLVDRLLSSPAYGERWARHWLDVAGYADSDGVTKQDSVRAWAYKYRDYVIRSFNANTPWNEFLIEQLAGDELLAAPYKDLSPRQADRLIATGFLRMSPDGTSGSNTDANAARNQVVAEVIKVVSTSLLGLGVACAQCHPHRYDPITHADYYRMRALFEPAYDWKKWRSPGARLVSQWSEKIRRQALEIDRQLKELANQRDAELDVAAEKAVEKRIAQLPAAIREPARSARKTAEKNRNDAQKQLVEKYPFLKVTRNSLQEIESGSKAAILKKWNPLIEAAGKKRPARDYLMCLTEVAGQVPATHLFARGDFNQPLQEVKPGELSILNPGDFVIPANNPAIPSTGRRLAYARHLTNGRHPLVARVLVNRFWMHHFGQGLVTTPGDFGVQGDRPSHPKLLDWLAAEFMENGWNLKRLHRLIVTSTAYRQVATRRRSLNAIDPDNRLLGRMSVRRIESEALRDSLLALSGRLVRTMHGRPAPVSLDSVGQRVIVSVTQYDPSGRLLKNVAAVGAEEFRRTIYIQVRRSLPLGVLVPFDLPTLKPNCVLRTVSTNAPQSLLMMNDPFVVRQVNDLARRICNEVGTEPDQHFQRAWRLVYGRMPSDAQRQSGLEFLEEQIAAVRAASPDNPDPKQVALSHLCQALISSNGFLYID